MEIVNVAKVLVKNTKGEYLVLRSSEWPENPTRSLQPDIAGGFVEENETHQIAASRELVEEAGILVDPSDLRLVYAHSEVYKEKSYNRLIFLTEVVDDTPVSLSWEHDKFWWSSEEDFLNLNWRRPYPEIFAYLQKINVMKMTNH